MEKRHICYCGRIYMDILQQREHGLGLEMLSLKTNATTMDGGVLNASRIHVCSGLLKETKKL